MSIAPLGIALIGAGRIGQLHARNMGFNRRFDPSLAAMRQAVREGDIGALEQIVVISRDPAPPPQLYVSQSGGIFRDMTIG